MTARVLTSFRSASRRVLGLPMILCVTLNSCLDKTLTVPDWEAGDNVRATEVREVVGGKGNNVARALHRLGRASRSVTFLGGVVGQRCRDLFRTEATMEPIIVASSAPTREIVTIRSPRTPPTAFFDPDPMITANEASALLDQVDSQLAAGEVEAITLSGSSPSPATHEVYCELIAMASARSVLVFLDTYGPSLAALWGFWPETISLNRREVGLLLHRDQPTDAEVSRLLSEWSRRGVRVAVVTDGPNDVLARVEGKLYRVAPPRIEVVNPIGSGDSLLAGLVDARLSGLDPEATLRRAVATASANALVWDAGAIDPAAVARLESAIRVEVEFP